MRIQKNIILFLLLAMASISSAQLSISTQGGEAAMNQNLEVDIIADEFNSLTTFQFNVEWDSLVMTFVEVKNVTTELVNVDGMSTYNLGPNFGLPGEGVIKDGTVSTSWEDFAGAQDLPDGTVLFTIVLTAIGEECATSSFGFTNQEAGNENFEEVSVTINNSSILVSGPDCGEGGGEDCVNECEGSTDVILSFPCVQAAPGSNICIPVTVYNFVDMESVQSGILWDPAVMTYTGVQNFGLPGLGSSLFNATNADQGELRQFWTEPNAETVTLDDGAVIYEICFDIIGTDGESTTLNFGSIGNFDPEVGQNGGVVPVCLDQGVITVGVPTQDPFELLANDVTGHQNGEACVDVTVREFNELRGLQFNMTWDNTILTYNDVRMFNSTLGLNNSNFNPNLPDILKFQWDNLTPTSLPNDTKLFQVCFDVIGDCEQTPTSPFDFVSTPDFAIEVTDKDANTLMYNVDNGSVTVLGCEHTCELVGVSQPDCFGGDGSITVSVDADDTCSCSWYVNGGTTAIQTTPGNTNCNLNSVGAGNYTFQLTNADGDVVCTFDQEIINPQEIVTNPTKSNAGCGDVGSITLNATGGTGSLSYDWTPNISSGDSATDLAAGEYSIVITDENSCSVTVLDTITTEIDPLMIDFSSTMVSDPICNGGSDGSIQGAASGGCAPYTFSYSDGGDGTDLSAGSYTITVEDSNGNTADATIEINNPDAIDLSPVIVNAPDGSITLSPSNGMSPYTYEWDPMVSTSESATNLSAGFYSVTVTDAKGCTLAMNNIEVLGNGIIGQVSITDVELCYGDNTGSISSSVGGGTAPYTITLSGAANESITLDSDGSFSFDELIGGSYTISVTDSDGTSDIKENILISQPNQIDATVEIGAEYNNCDGFIEVSITGGNSPYTYEWVNQNWDSPIFENVCAGSYDLIVTDANGCIYMLMNNIVIDSTGNVGECYVASEVITPNNDGLNDFFRFSCIHDRPASLLIFDRYGREVYTHDNYDNSFNGISDNGVELGEGGYMWVLNIDYGNLGRQIEKGTLTLLRE